MGEEVKSLKIREYLQLDTLVKEHVMKFMQQAILETFGAFRMMNEIGNMLDQINPKIHFITYASGKKEMQVDESDGRILEFFKNSFEKELALNPQLEKDIILAMTKRNMDTDRIKIK